MWARDAMWNIRVLHVLRMKETEENLFDMFLGDFHAVHHWKTNLLREVVKWLRNTCGTKDPSCCTFSPRDPSASRHLQLKKSEYKEPRDTCNRSAGSGNPATLSVGFKKKSEDLRVVKGPRRHKRKCPFVKPVKPKQEPEDLEEVQHPLADDSEAAGESRGF